MSYVRGHLALLCALACSHAVLATAAGSERQLAGSEVEQAEAPDESLGSSLLPLAAMNETEAASQLSSPAAMYLSAIESWLRQVPGQAAIASIALALGALCLWNGPTAWQAFFTLVAAVVAAAIALWEAKLQGLAPNVASQALLALLAAVGMGSAVLSGFEGFQILFGAAVGAWAAYALGDWGKSTENDLPGLRLLWYEVGAVAGVLVYTVLRRPALAMFASLLGALLAIGGGIVILSRSLALLMPNHSGAPLPDASMAWIDVMNVLLGGAGLAAVAASVGCALAAALLRACFNHRFPAVLCLVTSPAIITVATTTGLGCEVLPLGLGCSRLATTHMDRTWQTSSGVLWICVTALSAWRQLGIVKEWEDENSSTWYSHRSGRAATTHIEDNNGAEPARPSVRSDASTAPMIQRGRGSEVFYTKVPVTGDAWRAPAASAPPWQTLPPTTPDYRGRSDFKTVVPGDFLDSPVQEPPLAGHLRAAWRAMERAASSILPSVRETVPSGLGGERSFMRTQPSGVQAAPDDF